MYIAHRGDLEYAWTEIHVHRPGRKARGDLTALSCAQGQYPIVHTMNFWLEHAERYTLVEDKVRRTLQLGFYTKNPHTQPDAALKPET